MDGDIALLVDLVALDYALSIPRLTVGGRVDRPFASDGEVAREYADTYAGELARAALQRSGEPRSLVAKGSVPEVARTIVEGFLTVARVGAGDFVVEEIDIYLRSLRSLLVHQEIGVFLLDGEEEAGALLAGGSHTLGDLIQA